MVNIVEALGFPLSKEFLLDSEFEQEVVGLH